MKTFDASLISLFCKAILLMSWGIGIFAGDIVAKAPELCDCTRQRACADYRKNLTDTTGYIEPCVDETGIVPKYQRCLWNVLLDEAEGSILFEIEPDTFTFPEGDAEVQIGMGSKDSFTTGTPEEGLQETFNGTVNEPITVTITGNEAWVLVLLTGREGIDPFSFVYHTPNTWPSSTTSTTAASTTMTVSTSVSSETPSSSTSDGADSTDTTPNSSDESPAPDTESPAPDTEASSSSTEASSSSTEAPSSSTEAPTSAPPGGSATSKGISILLFTAVPFAMHFLA